MKIDTSWIIWFIGLCCLYKTCTTTGLGLVKVFNVGEVYKAVRANDIYENIESNH